MYKKPIARFISWFNFCSEMRLSMSCDKFLSIKYFSIVDKAILLLLLLSSSWCRGRLYEDEDEDED